jgi:nucleotide-binding universal stress UspA family protein
MNEEKRMYSKLLVPIDGAELSDPAMRGSIALARRLGARIAAFVAEPMLPLPAVGRPASLVQREQREHDAHAERHAAQLLEGFAEQARAAGVPFEGHFVYDDRVDEAICNAATQHGCDLIYMVTHGRGPLGQLLYGSHTKRVMARSRVPLLVVHRDDALAGTQTLQ